MRRSRRGILVFAGLFVLFQNASTSAQQQGPKLRPPVVFAPRPELSLTRLDVRVEAEVGQGVLTLHQKIADQFARQDFTPKERLTQFEGVVKMRPNPPFGHLLTGWWGRIQSLTTTPEGWLVKVIVQPRLIGCAAYIAPADRCYVETYEYSAGKLRFLNATFPPPGSPALITVN